MNNIIKDFIEIVLFPVGKTLYIYGGGWNYEDTSASFETTRIGLSNTWLEFFDSQNEYYDYQKFNTAMLGYNKYNYLGLDCSGYVGWVVYNLVNNSNGKKGYVYKSTSVAKKLFLLGLGTYSKNKDFKIGDIVSIKGHVYIVLGVLSDNSILIVHSSPTLSRVGKKGGGVQISAIGKSKNCEAYKLAQYYMSTYYKDWYERYDITLFDYDKYTDFTYEETGKFSFNMLNDSYNENISIVDVLKDIYHS